jgi:rfaE bifunctional protein nucleotidyltransferase chain/domain
MPTSSKIVSQKELKGILEAKQMGTVMCLGCFDPLHVGHLNHLEKASHWGDLLIVAVTRDEHVNKGPGRPHMPLKHRQRMLAALEFVDYVTDNDDAAAIVKFIKPRVYAKGIEYKDQRIPERGALAEYGGKMAYTDEPTMSSTGMLGERAQLLRDMAKLCVLVVGESIADTYTRCRLMPRKTKKHDAPSWTRIDSSCHDGGIMAPIGHLEGFAKEVMYPAIHRIVNKERFVDVETGEHFLRLATFPKYDRRDREAIQAALEAEFDVLIVNDFGHGLISETTAIMLSEKSAFTAINVQLNSAHLHGHEPTVLRYPYADYVCMNTRELAVAGGLDVVRKHFGPSAFLGVTHEDQMEIHLTHGAVSSKSLIHPSRVVDATGAGDAFFALSALALAAGGSAELAGALGAAAAAVTCTWEGNARTITPEEVLEVLDGPERHS